MQRVNQEGYKAQHELNLDIVVKKKKKNNVFTNIFNICICPGAYHLSEWTFIHIFGKFPSWQVCYTCIYLEKLSMVSLLLPCFLEEIPAFIPFPFQVIIVPCSSSQICSSVMIGFKHEVSSEKACNSIDLSDICITFQNFKISYLVLPKYFQLERNWFY